MKMTSTTIQVLVVGAALTVSCARKDASPAQPASSVVPQASQPAPLTDPNMDALHAWDDAHNRHDVEALRKVYGANVDFYGQKLTLEKVLAAKTKAFQQAPDFKQQISDIHVENKDGGAQATFHKTWTVGGKTRDVGAILQLETIGNATVIVKETDQSVGAAATTTAGDAPTMSVERATQLCLPSDAAALDWQACAELAERYDAGNGVPKDVARATELAKRACDTGITGMRAPFGRVFCYGFSERHGIRPPLGCCGEAPAPD